jgi:hypothetical protein
MKKRFVVVLLLLVAVVISVAGTSLSGELSKVIGEVLKFDRTSGEMVVSDGLCEKGKKPDKTITISDNERRVLRKNEDLMKGVNVNLDYEKTGNRNVVKRYLIIPRGC